MSLRILIAGSEENHRRNVNHFEIAWCTVVSFIFCLVGTTSSSSTYILEGNKYGMLPLNVEVEGEVISLSFILKVKVRRH